MPAAALPDGVFTVNVSAKDPSGVSTGSVGVPLTIDTGIAAPAGDLAAPSDSAQAGDQLTNIARPTIEGTGTPGDQISVEVAGQTLVTTVAADGSWAVTPPVDLPDGPYVAVVRSMDSAGNISAPIDGVLVTVDTELALTPVIAGYRRAGRWNHERLTQHPSLKAPASQVTKSR